MRSKESNEKKKGIGERGFFVLLYTSHRSPLSERLEQATADTDTYSRFTGSKITSHKQTLNNNIVNIIKKISNKTGLACVASVSVRFRFKERGTRVKDRAKSGASKTKRKRLLHRLNRFGLNG